MFISMQQIRDLFRDEFKESDIRIYGDPQRTCLVCTEVFHPDYYIANPHILYLSDQVGRIREIMEQAPEGSFVILSEEAPSFTEEYPETICVLWIKTQDLVSVHARLLMYFQYMAAYGQVADSLLEGLYSEMSIQDMIDQISPAIENPVFVFDAAFNLVAANWETAAKDEINEPLLRNKRFSDREYQIINRLDHIHERVRKSEEPLLVNHEGVPFEQLICAVDTKRDMGHIVINGSVRPFIPEDRRLLLLLKWAVNQYLMKDEFVRRNKGFPHEYFIKDLLEEKIAVGKRHYDSLKYVTREFGKTLYCIVVETARSSETLNVLAIRNDFEITFPNTKTMSYHGEIVMILNLGKNEQLDQEAYDRAAELCRKHRIFAGISNAFDDILMVKDYYKQGLRAIELGMSGNKNPDLFIYSDYYMQHITSLFQQREQPAVFCHPQMARLIQYDKAHQTEYAKDLYMYLVAERNSVSSAEMLHIHPNTMRYRLKKIDEMTELDLENAKERQYLILSYEIMQI